jgi:hypothetical protein
LGRSAPILRGFPIVLLVLRCDSSPKSSPTATAVPASPKAEAPSSTPPTSTESRGTTAKPTVRTWNFDSDASNAPPVGFSFGRTGSGPPGRWIVRAEPGAPSGANVLAQLDADDTDFRFPVAVASDLSVRDVRVSVRCKMVSGRVDQACGLVTRYADENNYFITRANALENNVRLYTVYAGKRSQLASFSGPVTPNAWHEYRFDVRGDHLEVYWNGKRVLDHHDGTFTGAGRVGVWTKADSVTSFDDLVVEAL